MHDAAACVTVSDRPAALIVAVLDEVPGFAAAANAIAPGPDPLLPPVIANQAALDAAVQLQPLAVVTVAVPPPPAAARAWLVGLSA